ncbi:DUF6941 family protein [Luteimicrobium sp. NPDC057192]|uniref:DUF6941 family protein n=1 Tax=Luteimicrobium sp. NPDC057192 TaxID=3346042 RepID=UPI0036341704
MKATVLLADSAQSDLAGKVHALGLGWKITSSPTPPMAVVVLVDLDWEEANVRVTLDASLVDSDGSPVLSPNAPNDPVSFHGEFETGRPAGIPTGAELRVPIAVNIGQGLPLKSGGSYRWHVELRAPGSNVVAEEPFTVAST